MRVIIAYTYKDEIDEFNHVTNIKQSFNFKLGARLDLTIKGKRNRKRIPVIDIKHMSVLE